MAAKGKVMPTVGGVPRVNLLPQESKAVAELRAVKSSMIFAVVGVMLAVAGGWFWANLQLTGAQQTLRAEQDRTQALVASKAQYAEVPRLRGLIGSIDGTMAAVKQFDTTWSVVLVQMLSQAPSSLRVITFQIDATTAVQDDVKPSDRLFSSDQEYALIVMNVFAPQIRHLATWVERLKAMPGYGEYWTVGFNFQRDLNGYVARFDFYFGEGLLTLGGLNEVTEAEQPAGGEEPEVPDQEVPDPVEPDSTGGTEDASARRAR